jgi:hypothetical protein
MVATFAPAIRARILAANRNQDNLSYHELERTIMTVSELIMHLSKMNPNAHAMILDGHNGGGVPREINLGPQNQKVKKADGDDAADCEGLVGKTVVVLGYGCY